VIFWILPIIFSAILFVTSFLLIIKPNLILDDKKGAFEVLEFAFENIN
jgi:hypothetical protein